MRLERHTILVDDIVRIEPVSEAELADIQFNNRINGMVRRAREEISEAVAKAKRKILRDPIDKLHDDFHARHMAQGPGYQALLAAQADAHSYDLGALMNQQAQRQIPPGDLYGQAQGFLGGLFGGPFGRPW